MFSNFKKSEIEIELEGRNVELKQKLRNEMYGIQRLVIFFIQNLNVPLKRLCSTHMKYFHVSHYMI